MNAFCKAVRLLIVLLTAIPLSQAAATWTTIDVPGATSTEVFRINNTGQMVGIYSDGTTFHGFLLSGGIFTTVDFPDAYETFAYGISDTGQIVGFYVMNGFHHGFLLDGQSFTSIDYPGALDTYAMDINNRAQIVGLYLDHNRGHGFELDGGNFTAIEPPGSTYSYLQGINNLGDIVGNFANSAGGFQGFAFSEGRFKMMIVFPGDSETLATGLNERRQVVGYTFTPGLVKGFAFFQGTYVRVNFPGARNTTPSGINLNGDIVGYYEDSSDVQHGFLRTRGTD